MNLKSKLLTPVELAPVTVSILGDEFPARRLTAACLSEHDKLVRKYQADNNGEKLNIQAAKLILDSILDENNRPMSESVKPADLMAIHTPLAINAAVTKIININYLSDDAEDTAKKD
ncbi:TPA: hypothetical protein NGU10_001474 [Vibrio parahaemolyticus]|uniref:hypothetical protein n=1 Tax=Vibrio diabolicus TaxID=50719 RepID=UPI00211AAA76|nr:hypothetical protein [Vibrio diabolicus]MCG6219263.1 hypothetical protein [Vibrio diabolicus]HCE2429426.1 hypothetical protein [Vibrio parahaemolyticus]HCE2486495.1 hypothetical protein [Vibrio parahaemolyticus]